MADNNTGLPLNGGTLSVLPGGASVEQITGALNDIITRLNSQLQLKSFGDGSNDLMQYGTLPDGSLGILLNDDSGNLVASFARRSDGSISSRIYDAGALIAEFGKTSTNSVGSKFYDSTGKGLALFGKYPDGNIHMRIAKPTFEVETATPDQLILNSDDDLLKVVETGSKNISGSSGTVSGQWSLTPASGSITFAEYSGANTPEVLLFVQDVSGNLAPAADGSLIFCTFASGFSQMATRRFNVTPTGIQFSIEYKGFLSAGTTSQPFSETYFYKVLQETI